MRSEPVRLLAGLLLGLLGMPAPASVAVQDARGQLVELAQPAQRIVALAPHFVENLYAIGAGERIVAAVDFVDFPPEATSLPSIGGYDSLSREAIVGFKPDLVLGWQTGNSAALLEDLERLGLKVYLDEPRELEDIPASLERLGVLTGHVAAARDVAEAFRSRLGELRGHFADRRPVRVFYQVWHEPLQTLNGAHVVSKLIRLCGGRNVFAEAAPLAPRVGMEAVLAAQPEVIIASGQTEKAAPELAHWRRWTQLPAVRDQHLQAIRPDWMLRFTPRILDGAARLCEVLEQAR